jgi:ATP-dependent DNA ligase
MVLHRPFEPTAVTGEVKIEPKKTTCRLLSRRFLPLGPKVLAQIEFLEMDENRHLRHSRFVGLRAAGDRLKVVKEQSGES